MLKPVLLAIVVGLGGLLGASRAASARSVVPVSKLRINVKVHFAPGSATLQRAARPLLESVAKLLKAHRAVDLVRIEGHVDAKETAKPWQLSLQRANAVRSFLMARGVSGRRLTPVGYGKHRPVATNRTAAGRAQNRRVAFRILSINGKPVR